MKVFETVPFIIRRNPTNKDGVVDLVIPVILPRAGFADVQLVRQLMNLLL